MENIGGVHMAFKNKFLSRLFGRKRDEEDNPEETTVKEKESAKPDAPAKPDPFLLNLPNDHPCYRLWNLTTRQIGYLPPAQLRLEVLEEPPLELPEGPQEMPPLLSTESIKHELTRLDEFVKRVAGRRLMKQNPDDQSIPDLNAEVQIFFTEQQMTAWVLIFPPTGSGADVTTEMLKSALKEAKIIYGIDESLLEQLPALPDRYFATFLVARGTPPLNGKDGYITELFSRKPSQALKEDEFGRVDFASLELFQNVKQGDPICSIVPPTPHQDGKTVLGKVCKAHVGQKATVPKGRNTELSEDGTQLIASCEGHVEFSGRSFQVHPVLEIGGNVDFSTGNLNCLGDIHIHGDVYSGFTVRATGNIIVDGVVEASTIEAGSDLIVRKGVQGNNRAILRAYRSIYTKYLESSSVYAHEDLETECIINCDVYSDGKITVRSGRGTIIGGQVRAARLISANIVGARSECQTEVFLGGHPCEDFERQILSQEIRQLEKELKKTEQQPDSPMKTRHMGKVRLQISANKLKLQQFDKELEKMKKAETIKDTRQERLVCNTLYPGTEITIGDAYLKVADTASMCTASLVAGEISLFEGGL